MPPTSTSSAVPPFVPQFQPVSLDEAIAELRSRIRGAVLGPGHEGYAPAVRAWNRQVEQRPVVAVVPASAVEVAEAVRFAKAEGLRVAVQATGRGVARPADGAVLIVTASLTDVVVDPVSATARVAAGAPWSSVLALAQQHGLAPVLGTCTDESAVASALGGGMGWLARRHGLAADGVRTFDVVTPDGIEVHASPAQQPEVLWALRGAGAGAFGVVTGMEIDLHPLAEVYAGNLAYPIDQARDVVLRWRDWVADQPAELTSSVALVNELPGAEAPAALRGRAFVMVRGAWCGELAAGEAVLGEWRRWRAPAVDRFGPMPFGAIGSVSAEPAAPQALAVTSESFDTLPDDAVEVVVRAIGSRCGRPPLLAFAELRHAGGAVRANGAAAVDDRGRSGEFVLRLVAVTTGEHHALAVEAHLRQVRRSLAPFVNGATRLDLLDGREQQQRTPTAFSSEHLARLRAVKSALDADDRFAHGLGITP